MTAGVIAAAREWITHYGHLNTTGLEARNAVRTAELCLERLRVNPESPAAAELKTTMDALCARLELRPVLPPLHRALQEGWFLPLDQFAALGVHAYRPVRGPRVRRGFNVITGRKF